MRTWFLCKVKYAKETEEGLLKSISEQYLVDAVSFTEAETILYAKLSAQIRGDFQVTGISKSNIVDVFFYKDAEIWYKCKITYLIADGDSGKEKKVTQYMIVTAEDVKQAYDRIQESLGSMLVSFRVPDITESPILEVFPFEKSEVSPGLPSENFNPITQEMEEEE